MRSRISASLLLSIGLCMASVSVQAQSNPLIIVNENGNGTLTFPSAAAVPISGVLAADPGPGGRTSTLTYNLQGPPALVAGDVFLTGVVGGPTLDVIRFNPGGTGSPNYQASLVFYSLNGSGSLAYAPTGPSAFYPNTLTTLQGIDYTPTTLQPGFVAGFSVTYRIVGTPAAVPEPGSVALLIGLSVTGAGFLARRKRACA